MKFSRITLVAAFAPAAVAFVLPIRPNVGLQRDQLKPAFMALEDLESKLLGTKAPEPTKTKPVPKPVPKPEPKPAPKLESKPTPKPEAKPAPAVNPKPQIKIVTPAVKSKATTVVTTPPRVPPAPAKTAPAATTDDLALVKGLALGTAPLALGALAALAAGRDVLTKTAARREEIQKKIAAQEAAAKKKSSIGSDIDGGALVGAVGFLGAAVVSLGLIVVNPFTSLPSLPSLPSTTGSTSTANYIGQKKVSEAKAPSAGDEARAKIRKAQAELLASKKTAQDEAKLAAASAPAPTRALKTKKATNAEFEYDSLIQKATTSGPKVIETKEEKKLKKEEKVAETKATLAAGEAQKALEEAKAKTMTAEVISRKLEVADKQEKIDIDLAAQEKKFAATESAKQEKIAKEALAKNDAATAATAAEKEIEAKKAAELLAKQAKEDAIKEAKLAREAMAAQEAAKAAQAKADAAAAKELAAEKELAAIKAKETEVAVAKSVPAPVPAPSPVAEAPATNGPSGGRVLPKEEVSDDVKAFLKNYKK